MAPLYALLQSNAKWVCVDKQEQVYEDAKKTLSEFLMLVHFDNKLLIILSCDANLIGVSCVLVPMINNEERPALFIRAHNQKQNKITRS